MTPASVKVHVGAQELHIDNLAKENVARFGIEGIERVVGSSKGFLEAHQLSLEGGFLIDHKVHKDVTKQIGKFLLTIHLFELDGVGPQQLNARQRAVGHQLIHVQGQIANKVIHQRPLTQRTGFQRDALHRSTGRNRGRDRTRRNRRRHHTRFGLQMPIVIKTILCIFSVLLLLLLLLLVIVIEKTRHIIIVLVGFQQPHPFRHYAGNCIVGSIGGIEDGKEGRVGGAASTAREGDAVSQHKGLGNVEEGWILNRDNLHGIDGTKACSVAGFDNAVVNEGKALFECHGFVGR